MSNVPDGYSQSYCSRCGENPCDCGSEAEEGCYGCGGELDEDGFCPDCDVGVAPDDDEDE